jgi:hypothetical protein
MCCVFLICCSKLKKEYYFDDSYFELVSKIMDNKCCDTLIIICNTKINYDSLSRDEYNSGFWLNKKRIPKTLFNRNNQLLINEIKIDENFKIEKPNSLILTSDSFNKFDRNTEPFKKAYINNSILYIDELGKGAFFLSLHGAQYYNFIVFVKKKGYKISIIDFKQIDTNFPW